MSSSVISISLNDDNKFPIKKFGALANHLLETDVVKKFHIPKECSIETMKTSHSLKYINNINAYDSDPRAGVKKTFITLIFHEIFRILYSLHKRSPKRMVLI